MLIRLYKYQPLTPLTMKKFNYQRFDVIHQLPSSWKTDIIKHATSLEKKVLVKPKSVTSRELDTDLEIDTLVVDGGMILSKIPWLYDLYRGLFFEYAKQYSKEEVYITRNPKYAINLNIQRGSDMRYECHVDSNPIQGLLYITDHPKGEGGELIVSNDSNAKGIKEIESNCTTIYPVSGQLLFFDGRENPHFVKPLNRDEDVRIVAAMNFYTESTPEDTRPRDLDNHLFNY